MCNVMVGKIRQTQWFKLSMWPSQATMCLPHTHVCCKRTPNGTSRRFRFQAATAKGLSAVKQWHFELRKLQLWLEKRFVFKSSFATGCWHCRRLDADVRNHKWTILNADGWLATRHRRKPGRVGSSRWQCVPNYDVKLYGKPFFLLHCEELGHNLCISYVFCTTAHYVVQNDANRRVEIVWKWANIKVNVLLPSFDCLMSILLDWIDSGA